MLRGRGGVDDALADFDRGWRVGLGLGVRLSQFGFAFLTTLHLGGGIGPDCGRVGVAGFPGSVSPATTEVVRGMRLEGWDVLMATDSDPEQRFRVEIHAGFVLANQLGTSLLRPPFWENGEILMGEYILNWKKSFSSKIVR